MPRYYNKLRTPLTLQLPSGPAIVAPKSFIELSPSEEVCSSVVKRIKQNKLIPPKFRGEVSFPAPVKEVKKEAKPEPKEVVEAPKEESPAKEETSEAPKKTRRRKRKAEKED